MGDDQPALLMSTTGLVAMTGYLVLLVVLGLLGAKAKKEASLADFYLSGRRMGLVVLVFTLYATQYSGNTLVGFAAKAYRSGFFFLVSVPFMMGVVGMYLIYAPRLRALSEKRGYITLSDFIHDRFGNRTLTTLVALSGIIAMANYIISNLKAVGFTFAAATGGAIGEAEGIILFAIIVLIYETLGGLRSVAWTDVAQGGVLFIGCVVIFTTILQSFGGLGAAMAEVQATRPDFWAPPTGADLWLWISTLLVVSIGIAIYPHAIQRIYAAGSARSLRRAFQIMVFLPLLTTLFMILVGILGTARFPELDATGSESVTLRMLQALVVEAPGTQWIVVLFITAVLAAIMSTVDSALLSISSMLTQDLFRPLRPGLDQASLTRFGKRVSWVVMGGAVLLAIELGESIWGLIEIKLELLMQIAPALFLGLHWRRLGAPAVLGGFLVGSGLTLFFSAGSNFVEWIPKKPFGIHSGLLGLAGNLVVLGGIQCASGGRRRAAL